MAIIAVFKYGFTGIGRKRAGFAEKHYHTQAVNPQDAAADAIKLSNARINICGRNVEFLSIALVELGGQRRSMPIIAGQTFEGAEKIKTAPTNMAEVGVAPARSATSDLQDISLRQVMEYTPARKKSVYLAGIPDAIMRTSDPGPDFAAVEGFGTRWCRWRDVILSAGQATKIWGFQSRKATSMYDVVAVSNVVEEPFWIRVDIAGAGIAKGTVPESLVTVGDKIQVRGMRPVRDGDAVPNGIWKVVEVVALAGGRTGYVLRGTSPYDAMHVHDPGKVQFVAHEILPYQSFGLTEQSRRKRGGRSTAAAGRSSHRQILRGR